MAGLPSWALKRRASWCEAVCYKSNAVEFFRLRAENGGVDDIPFRESDRIERYGGFAAFSLRLR